MDPAAILSGYAAVPFLVYTDPPRPPVPRKGGKTALIAGVILLVLLIGIPVALARPDDPRPAAVPTALTSVSPGPSTAPTQGSPPPSGRPPSPQSPDPFTVTGEVGLRCLASGQYSLTVEATSNEPLTQAILLYQAGSGALYFDTMTIKPSRLEATGEGDGLSHGKIKWWIKASSADGETAHSSPVISDNPCS